MHEPLILIAEDDSDDALMLKDAFSEINQNAVTFLENGKLLIEHLQRLLIVKKRPRLILIDLNMPILDGRGVIIELKRRAETKDIPVVVLSTSKSKDDMESVLALGANDFFTKPASFSDLVNIVTIIANKWMNTK